jgi:hypothetical protein
MMCHEVRIFERNIFHMVVGVDKSLAFRFARTWRSLEQHSRSEDLSIVPNHGMTDVEH